jgi:hypothetical protein
MTDDTHSSNKEASEWSNREMGALWKKDGRSQKFYSGFLKLKNNAGEISEEVSIIIFANKHKNSDKAPDLIVYRSEDAKKPVDHDEVPETFI